MSHRGKHPLANGPGPAFVRALFASAVVIPGAIAAAAEVRSPDGHVVVAFDLVSRGGLEGCPAYRNLWYSFNYTPAYENNLPQIDHIFPQCLLRKVKEQNPKTGRTDLTKYKESARNQLANCMLLTQAENGAGGKGDTPPCEWFKDMPRSYLDLHLIPPDPSLWELDRFKEFVSARKGLIAEKFAWLLQGTGSGR